MPHLRPRLIVAMLAICVLAMTGRAVADDLGGVADIRAWASAPPLGLPVVVSAHGTDLNWSFPASPVFRYLGAAAGPTSGQYGQYDAIKALCKNAGRVRGPWLARPSAAPDGQSCMTSPSQDRV